MKQLGITMVILIFAMTTVFAQSREERKEERKEDRQEKVADLKKDVQKKTEKTTKSVKKNFKKVEIGFEKTTKKAKKELTIGWNELTEKTENLIDNIEEKVQENKVETKELKKSEPAKSTNRELKKT
jgi:hypothetical protein